MKINLMQPVKPGVVNKNCFRWRDITPPTYILFFITFGLGISDAFCMGKVSTCKNNILFMNTI